MVDVGFGCSRSFECENICSPNLTSIKACRECKDLKNPEHGMLPVLDTTCCALMHIQPFQSCVGMELVKLELEVMGSIGSKCTVICVFTVGNFGCLLGCHCPVVQRIQELAQVVCEERVG